jgi:hypothetical protein
MKTALEARLKVCGFRSTCFARKAGKLDGFERRWRRAAEATEASKQKGKKKKEAERRADNAEMPPAE